jgi:hypothetical protein
MRFNNEQHEFYFGIDLAGAFRWVGIGAQPRNARVPLRPAQVTATLWIPSFELGGTRVPRKFYGTH